MSQVCGINLGSDAVDQSREAVVPCEPASLGQNCAFRVTMGHGGKPWVADFDHPHFKAGRNAMKTGKKMGFCEKKKRQRLSLNIGFRISSSDFVSCTKTVQCDRNQNHQTLEDKKKNQEANCSNVDTVAWCGQWCDMGPLAFASSRTCPVMSLLSFCTQCLGWIRT